MKKFTSFILAAALGMALLTGCGPEKPAAEIIRSLNKIKKNSEIPLKIIQVSYCGDRPDMR